MVSRSGDDVTTGSRDAPVTLQELERRRWQLWVVAGLLILSVSAAVVLVLGAGVATELSLAESPGLRYGFLGVSVAFLLYVADQERTFRRITRTLFESTEAAEALQARIDELTTLLSAARTVNSVLAPEEVYSVLLRSALDLAGASTGAVFLRVGDHLTVAVAAGENAPGPGARIRVGDGPIGRVAMSGEPEIVGGGEGADGRRRSSGVSAPLVVQGRRVGVLAVERAPEAPAFTAAEVSTVMLFAEHAATVVANANRYEGERTRVEALADAAEQRAEFLATMVHDLRSPLSAMRGYAQLLRDRDDRLTGPQRSSALEGLHAQGGRLDRMIDEILASSSVEAGAELPREPVDLGAVLEEARRTLTSVAHGHGDGRVIELRDRENAGVVTGDPEALRHVFVNLVENAVKYSDPGTPVSIGVERGSDHVKVHVVDRGHGIAKEDLPYVFERFRQSSKPSAGGVGLGLYIVRTLVQAHGGRVTANSEVGTGTVFTVTLPIRDEAKILPA